MVSVGDTAQAAFVVPVVVVVVLVVVESAAVGELPQLMSVNAALVAPSAPSASRRVSFRNCGVSAFFMDPFHTTHMAEVWRSCEEMQKHHTDFEFEPVPAARAG